MSFRIARFVLVPLFMLPNFNAVDTVIDAAQFEFNQIRARKKG